MLVPDLLRSLAVDLPTYQLLGEQARGFVTAQRPTHLVTILETYCYGRAVTRGTRLAGQGTKVVGLQHSPANRNQLFYRYMPTEVTGPDPVPLPDLFLLHGQLVEQQLREAGVEAARLRVVGAPRYLPLLDYRRLRGERRRAIGESPRAGEAPEGRMILLAGVIWADETARILRWAFAAMAGLQETGATLVIKPHPMNRGLENLVEELTRRYPGIRCVLTDERLDALQTRADVMITGNSTSDVDAVAIGCPVIKLSTFDISSSPTDEFPDCVTEVRSPAELQAALGEPARAHDAGQLVTWALGPLDDRICERIHDALLDAA